jgi:hypothetical protein
MKTLNHKIIIYDDVCPLCKAYTDGFVQIGWLLPEHRLGFSNAPQNILDSIDINRARHEIPLYDTETGETLYGKEALFFIFGEAFPLLKPLFRFSFFRTIIFGLYQIITYNRRIIAGSKTPQTGFDCAPDFNAFYRWLYTGLMTLFSCIIFYNNIQVVDIVSITWISLFLVGILRGLFFKDFKTKTTYFGHLATVVFIAHFIISIFGTHLFTFAVTILLSVFLMKKRINLV